MSQKPSIPKGTRDFSPIEMAKRNYIFDTIRDVYKLFGYKQIETPAQETLQTLMGKYGEEGDKLLFKVLNSGDFLKNASDTELAERNPAHLAAKFCERGLRYDLTVPFARYVVMHREEIQLPFKRYQIQPVWRADRPQKGRYREFYQCDADVVGSDSLLNEVELIQIIDTVFQRLKIRTRIHVNNRKILMGIAETIGCPDKIVPITVAIDKLSKIGLEGVNAELTENGISPESVERLQPILKLDSTDNESTLNLIETFLKDSEVGQKGIEETRFIINTATQTGLVNELQLDLTLARGLNYYTGAIFEVTALDTPMGSITGGGRYDNLTGIFGMPGLSGVGISFGADRIYDVLTALNLFPEDNLDKTQILFINFSPEDIATCLPYAKACRQNGIPSEIYPDSVKMKKQMAYANAQHIPFVAMVGEDERQKGVITLRDMSNGEQQQLTIQQTINFIISKKTQTL